MVCHKVYLILLISVEFARFLLLYGLIIQNTHSFISTNTLLSNIYHSMTFSEVHISTSQNLIRILLFICQSSQNHVCDFVCVRAWVRECVSAWVRECVRACVRACGRACMRACVCSLDCYTVLMHITYYNSTVKFSRKQQIQYQWGGPSPPDTFEIVPHNEGNHCASWYPKHTRFELPSCEWMWDEKNSADVRWEK